MNGVSCVIAPEFNRRFCMLPCSSDYLITLTRVLRARGLLPPYPFGFRLHSLVVEPSAPFGDGLAADCPNGMFQQFTEFETDQIQSVGATL